MPNNERMVIMNRDDIDSIAQWLAETGLRGESAENRSVDGDGGADRGRPPCTAQQALASERRVALVNGRHASSALYHSHTLYVCYVH